MSAKNETEDEIRFSAMISTMVNDLGSANTLQEIDDLLDTAFQSDPQSDIEHLSTEEIAPSELTASQPQFLDATVLKSAKVFLDEASTLAGAPLPLGDSQGYRSHRVNDPHKIVLYMALAGEKYLKLKDYRKAILWTTEALVVYDDMCTEVTKHSPKFGWTVPHFSLVGQHISAICALRARARVLRHLGNTGASIGYIMRAVAILSDLPARFGDIDNFDLLYVACLSEFQILAHCQHPDPSLVFKIGVVDEILHINGSWKKIHLDRPGGVTKRFGAGVFIYDGYMYVLGGEKNSNRGPFYLDFWRLNLQKLHKWQRLPVCPIPRSTRSISNQNMTLWNDTAYYFTGSQTLYCFDLKKLEWSLLATTFIKDNVLKASWPYLPQEFREFTMNCVDGRLYVFGGSSGRDELNQGSDLFMELDIPAGRWRRLSGVPQLLNATAVSPGPRVSAISWVVPRQKKIYIAHGHANRIASTPEGQTGINYPYDDIWSWDITGECWSRERVRGNPPGPRSEMAAVYSSKLNKLVVFGGYNPTAPHKVDNKWTRFSYLADTFVCDINTRPVLDDESFIDPVERVMEGVNWRQVLTRGFPTYRARANLIEDPISGKIFLFSGYFEQEFLHTLQIEGDVRCFSDIWELRIDLPGGNFDGVDVEEEARTAKTGPWLRCFSCGSVGSWKKCTGICNGRAYFCDRECQTDGWEEHKAIHGCRKVGR